VPFSSSNGLVIAGIYRLWLARALTPFLEFDGERLTYLSYRTGLSHVWVATGDLANCNLSADIRPPSVDWGRRTVLDCREKQKIAIERFGNKAACKANVVPDSWDGAEVLVLEVGVNTVL